MTTKSILTQMAAHEQRARMKAVAYHAANHRPGPVRGRLVGRRIQGGNAWSQIRSDGGLFGMREFRG